MPPEGCRKTNNTTKPASDVAAKLIGWMRDHPECSGKDWVDCLDDAIATLKLCKP